MQAALTSDQLVRARGSSSVASQFTNRIRISTNPNTLLFQALVNQTSFGDSFAQVTFDTVTTGAYTDLREGMTVYIGSTSDLSKATFIGRVRADNSGVVATSTILNINENSFDIQNNWVISVTNDYRIWDRLAREVAGVQYNDYSITFRQLLPVVYNLATVYAGDIDPNTEILTLSFEPEAFAATSGATISTWAWAVGDGTITVGSSSTQNVTIEFPEGHRWIHLTVTDSGGRSITRHIEIHAHGDTYTYQLMAVESLTFNHPVGTGRDGSLTNYVAPAGLLDLTQITVWSDDSDQIGRGAISEDNIIFVGRIRTRTNDSEASTEIGIASTAAYMLEGPLTQLARTEQLAYEMLNVASPTTFGQIANMTLYRGIVYLLSEYSTFLELHSLEFDSFDNTFIAPTRNPSGDVLTAVNDLALSINAALQIDGAGRAEVVRNGVMLETTSDRNALVTRAAITTADLIKISIKQDGARIVGKLPASGGSYNTATGQYLVSEAKGEGLAPGSGSESRSLERQVFPVNLSQGALDAALKTRATHAFEKAQEVDTLTATFTPQWHGLLIPSLNTWFTFTVAADVTVDGVVIGKTVLTTATRWLLTDVSLSYNSDGIPEVTGTFIRETFGVTKPFTIIYPPISDPTLPVVPAVPSLPMFQVPPLALPDAPTGGEIPVGVVKLILPLDGNAWIVGGDNSGVQSLLLTTTMLTRAIPYTREIVPPISANEVIRDAKVNPFGLGKGVYALYYDSVLETSRIWYLEDVTAYPPVWTAGEMVVGEYTELRLGNANGKVMILGSIPVAGNCADDWSIYTGTETARTGSTITGDAVFGGGSYHLGISATGYVTFPPAGLCRRVTFSRTPGGLIGYWPCGTNTETIGIYIDACVWNIDYVDTVPFSCTFTFAPDDTCGDCDDTFAALTAYSTDFGATLSTPGAIGVAATWFDTAKASDYSLVSTGTQTRKSSGGGAWGDYGSAKASADGYISRYLLTASGSNSSANPQFVQFASVLDSAASLWIVSSSGAAFTDITPVDGTDEGLATGNGRGVNVNWQTSGSTSHILIIGLFGATVKLGVSLDAGATWHFSAALDVDAFNLVTQRGDRLKRLAGFINGSAVAVVRNYQATTPVIIPKTFPLTTISVLDVWG